MTGNAAPTLGSGPLSAIGSDRSRQSAVHPKELEQDATHRAYLFGHPRMFRSEQRLALEAASRKKGLEILLWFLLNPGRPCSTDQFIDTMWPETDPDKALCSFHVSMHSLRRMLEPELGPRKESSFIRRHNNRVYTFEPSDQWWTDVADLELHYRRGHECDLAGEEERARFYYWRVSDYVSRGPLLDGETSPWLDSYRRKYELMCSQALGRLMQLLGEGSREEELLESAYQMLRVDRYNQLAARVIIEASLRHGNQHRAERQLKAFCEGVQNELGLPVPREFVDIRRRLRSGRTSAARLTPRVTPREVRTPSFQTRRAG